MRTLTTLAATIALCAGSAASAQTLVVLNKAEASVTLLNPATGEAEATLPVGVGPHEAATSPDGRTVVVCDYGTQTPGNTLTVIDLPTREVLRTIDLGENRRPHGIRFLDDDRVVVTSEVARKIAVVNIRAGAVERTMDTEQGASHMVEVSRDGTRAFVPNIGPGTVSVIDMASGELLKILETGAGAEGVFAHPTKNEIWVTNRSADTVSVIDSDTLEIIAEIGCGVFPIRVAITPDGAHALVSCAQSGDVAVIDTETREEIARISMQATAVEQQERDRRLFGDQFGNSPVPVGVLVRPDGRYAFVANTNADVVTVLDLAGWTIETRLVAGQEPDGMAWSPLPER
ncbi:MAG: cytochrome D1 domain-containing protein [Phycisphaerales bacterium]